jgi:ketosteroid isomerase-like protein
MDMKSNSEIVSDFLGAFLSGDVDHAKELISPNFSFRAPMHTGVGDAQAYFGGAEAKARLIEDFRILRQWEDGGDVATIYEIDIRTDEGRATLPMTEWHKVADGKIQSTFMIFNANSPAVRLMTNALSHHA